MTKSIIAPLALLLGLNLTAQEAAQPADPPTVVEKKADEKKAEEKKKEDLGYFSLDSAERRKVLLHRPAIR